MKKIFLTSFLSITILNIGSVYASNQENIKNNIGMNPADLLGLVTKTTTSHYPINKDGTLGTALHSTKIDYTHNTDSNVPVEKGKEIAQSAINKSTDEPPKDQVTLGILSSIGNVVLKGAATILHTIMPTTE